MKKIIISLFFVAIATSVFAQSAIVGNSKFAHRNSVQLELFGHGAFYSFNFERVLINWNRLKTTAQIGVSYYPPFIGVREIWIPIGINELISFGKHHIEIGIGQVFTNEKGHDLHGNPGREWDGLFSGRIGYRYQKPNGRLIIRAGYTPFYEYWEGHAFHSSGGLAIGYSF